MEGEKIEVKYDKKWYPAIILRTINSEEVEIEYEDPDYPPEIVSISDRTRALKVSSNSLSSSIYSIKPKAGEFNKQHFECFFKYIMGDSKFVTPLSIEELKDLDLKTSLYSTHASERIEERFSENMQELRRSINATEQYLAYRQTRKRVFCGCIRIDCTPDLKHIHSIKMDEPTSVIEHLNQELQVDISHLKNEVIAHTPDIGSLDLKSCTLFGDIVCNHVVTTTTRFVLNENCSKVVTVITHDKSFGEWGKHNDKTWK